MSINEKREDLERILKEENLDAKTATEIMNHRLEAITVNKAFRFDEEDIRKWKPYEVVRVREEEEQPMNIDEIQSALKDLPGSVDPRTYLYKTIRVGYVEASRLCKIVEDEIGTIPWNGNVTYDWLREWNKKEEERKDGQ